MIGSENSAILVGVLGGVVVGGGLSLWRALKEADDKCEFLSEAHSEMQSAFDGADALLGDERLPPALRVMLLYLLHAYTDDSDGKRFATSVFFDGPKDKQSDDNAQENPLADAMRQFADIDPAAARVAHRVLGSLTIGLFVVHYGDGIVARRVQQQLASDPVSIWAKIASFFGIDSGHRGGRSGGMLLVQ